MKWVRSSLDFLHGKWKKTAVIVNVVDTIKEKPGNQQ